MTGPLVRGLRNLNQPAAEQAGRISSKLQRLRELMQPASFLAWYVGTSLVNDELEREIDSKLEQLENGESNG